MNCLLVSRSAHKQIDLRKESTIRVISPSSYPVITFGPFASPTEVLISLSKAIGNFLNKGVSYKYFTLTYVVHFLILEKLKVRHS